jgi:DNA gyrase subunit A
VEDGDQILLVSDQGQLIRIPVRQVRLAGRNTQGVIIFRKHQDEHVVSVERLADTGDDDDIIDEAPDAGPAEGEGGEA